jgi:predicted nucleic acid-binding protein
MFLLDTNVISELRKIDADKANANVARWAKGVLDTALHLSVISVQEIEIGVLLAERRDPLQGAVLRKWLENNVLVNFAQRILPVDLRIVRCSARMHVPEKGSYQDKRSSPRRRWSMG